MSDYLNNPSTENYSRKPRASVLLSDGTLLYPISFEVTTTNNLTADIFEMEFPLYGSSNDVSFWANQMPPMMVTIQIGYLQDDDTENDAIDYQMVVQGQVDDFELDLNNGTVTAHGRDLSSNFIDTKIASSYQNMTSSAIVALLAAGHGMQTDIDPTDTPVGRYYQQDHTNTNQGEFSKTTTEWDFMCFLARIENYDLYVTGNTVHFKKAVNETNNSSSNGTWLVSAPVLQNSYANVSTWTSGSNVDNFRIHRSLTLAKDIKVIVQGWHSKNGKSFKATAERNKSSGSVSSGSVQQYVYNVHNITTADAQNLANSLLSDISKHEYVISWEEPGDITLTARTLVKVTDTNSVFDTTYYIDTIKFDYNISDGFKMHVHAKNHSTSNQTTV